jgi:DUF4097 and DUF4098 domain-containing protein YvlB
MNRNIIIKFSSFLILSIAFVLLIIYYSKALPTTENNRFKDFFSRNFLHRELLRDTSGKTFQVESGGVLYMETDGADIRVETWDKNEVNVIIEKRGNKDRLEDYKVTFSASPKRVEIFGKMERHIWNWDNFSITFKIKMPKQFNPEIKTSGGDITLRDITGEIQSKTSGGDIHIENCRGNITVNTSGGDIVIGRIQGDLKVETSGGSIKMDEINGKIQAETSGGDIEADVLGENQGIFLKTSGGDINIHIPTELKGNVDCSTSGGDVSLNVSGGFSGEIKDNKIKGLLNGGGNEFKARTSGGDIKISSRLK